MQKRNTQQRRRQIVELLNQQGEVSVEQLSNLLSTSEVTIRKDLSSLEANGILVRRHGGAVPIPQEMLQDAQDKYVSERKLAIAKTAATLIRDHNRIIIDSGNTTGALLPELSNKQGLIVMTNSLTIANSLLELENEPTLLMTGGTWDPHSESFQGKLAEQVLTSYDFDQLFIGANGIDLERGTTTFNELYTLSRAMADVAREVIVMVESDKIGRRIHNLELPWDKVDCLVTDSGIHSEAKQKIEDHGVTVMCAELQSNNKH